MARIIGISGSLRRGSYNAALLRAAVTLAPAAMQIDIRTLHGVPLYNADDEAADGIPEIVSALKDDIASADGLLIVTPEYNNGVPGVLKNAVDWLSRPPADIPRVFGGKPVAIMGATPGNFGTILAQNAWLPVMRTLGAQLLSGAKLMAPSAGKLFDENGELVDEKMRERLANYLKGFADFIGSR